MQHNIIQLDTKMIFLGSIVARSTAIIIAPPLLSTVFIDPVTPRLEKKIIRCLKAGVSRHYGSQLRGPLNHSNSIRYCCGGPRGFRGSSIDNWPRLSRHKSWCDQRAALSHLTTYTSLPPSSRSGKKNVHMFQTILSLSKVLLTKINLSKLFFNYLTKKNSSSQKMRNVLKRIV